jgi:SAM-dependent methyltransferase
MKRPRQAQPAWRWALRIVLLAVATSAWFSAPPAQAQEDVPFITTPDAVTLAMLQLAGVGPQDTVVDLGSGDGRIVITAARRFGARGLGVEIVPGLVAASRLHAQAAGVAERAAFVEQDLFATDLAQATVVTMYLLPAVNLQLRPRLLALKPGTRIVSHDWDLGDWQPDRSLTLDVPDKAIGKDKRSTVHLWVVPARVQGLWCSAGVQMDITQRFQRFSASFMAAGAAMPQAVVDGQVGATELYAPGTATGTQARLRLDDAALTLAHATGALAVWEGRRFSRAGPAGCAAA